MLMKSCLSTTCMRSTVGIMRYVSRELVFVSFRDVCGDTDTNIESFPSDILA
jgi:hypothetical protein